MNELIQQTDAQLSQSAFPTDMMTQELERLWLLSALKVGLEQAANGQTILADDGFFNALETRLFGCQPEVVIEA